MNRRTPTARTRRPARRRTWKTAVVGGAVAGAVRAGFGWLLDHLT
ncbi:hypothetical protein [Streptodolium elevatio]|uniref:Uncharacterized protein n=1 Tax=Streptodolium elevatio TaxID=3157996 RepID=A0ABV3DGP2_9ACTN